MDKRDDYDFFKREIEPKRMKIVKFEKKILIFGSIILLVLLLGNAIYQAFPQLHPGGTVTGEYGKDYTGLFGTNPAYEIGVNQYGMPIFKDPEAAYNEIIVDCKDGIQEINKQFNVGGLNKWNWKAYMIYGDQLAGTNSDPAKKQGSIVSCFFGIYENSFMTK